MMIGYSFEALAMFLSQEKELWVRLNTDVPICLIGTADAEKQVFKAKFLPCAKNSKVYEVPYAKIQCLDSKRKGDRNGTAD